jgi:hypothetical protein
VSDLRRAQREIEQEGQMRGEVKTWGSGSGWWRYTSWKPQPKNWSEWKRGGGGIAKETAGGLWKGGRSNLLA